MSSRELKPCLASGLRPLPAPPGLRTDSPGALCPPYNGISAEPVSAAALRQAFSSLHSWPQCGWATGSRASAPDGSLGGGPGPSVSNRAAGKALVRASLSTWALSL